MSDSGEPVSAPPAETSARLEEADVLAGLSGVGRGLVRRSRSAPARVQFSIVGSRAVLEGDIDLGTAAEFSPPPVGDDEQAGVVVVDSSRRWPRGRVPYVAPPPSSPISTAVDEAVAEYARRTPVDWVPREPHDTDYVVFEVNAYCSSRVGRRGGRQTINLSPSASTGNALHEMCHAVGLWHEQSREDRDQHMAVVWDNVLEGYEHNFRQRLTDGDDVGPYDFASIMHYPPDAFSRDGQPTLRALDGARTFGQRDRLSDGDLAALRALYGSGGGSGDDSGVPDTGSATVTTAGLEPGTQFRVAVPPGGSARVATRAWRADRRVHWEVVPVDGSGGVPLLEWTVSTGLSRADGGPAPGAAEPGSSGGARPGRLDYYFAIRNLTGRTVLAEARYSLLSP